MSAAEIAALWHSNRPMSDDDYTSYFLLSAEDARELAPRPVVLEPVTPGRERVGLLGKGLAS